MSFSITNAMVQQYKNNVIHLSQQKGSRLRGTVRTVPSIVGLNYYFERIGATAVQIKESRHSPTPLISTPHSRRRVTMVTYNWGDVTDNDDKLKVLINPTSEYAIAAGNAFGRNMDDIIIAGALGTAFAGPDGATAVNLPSTGGPLTTGQYIARTALNVDISTQIGPTGGTDDASSMSPMRVRLAKYLFDAQDVDPDEERFMLASPNAILNMLRYTEVTSADYNVIKALAAGAIDSYLGFKWIQTNRLPIVGTATPLGVTYPAIGSVSNTADRLCLAYCRQGIGLGVQEDVVTKIAERADMSFSTQIYMEMVMGATRIEEPKVVVIPVLEQ